MVVLKKRRAMWSRDHSRASIKADSTPKKSVAATATDSDKTPRHVTFCEHVQIHNDGMEPPLTESERSAAFYTKQEINGFDKERAVTVLMYKKRREIGMGWDDCGEQSIRGLEEVFQPKTRIRIKKGHVAKVLAEQGRQRQAEGHDPEVVRDIAAASSKNERERALSRGRMDAHAGYKTYSSVLQNMIKRWPFGGSSNR